MNPPHRVEDYFAEVLDPEERAEFERHLAACTTCQDELEALRRLDARLSTELPRTVPSREPSREWVEQVKASLRPPRRFSRRRLVLAGVVATAATALVLVILLVLKPWGSSLTPEQTLAQAYEATLAESFRGTITVMDESSLVLSGTFAHAPDDRWAVGFQTAVGQEIEEVQIGDEIWRREGEGQWAPVEGGVPMYILPRSVGPLVRLPSLIEAVSTLSEVSNPAADTYTGVDQLYLARLRRDAGGNAFTLPTTWLADNPPEVEAAVLESGQLKRMRFNIKAPGDAGPIVVNLTFDGYGTPVEIEPPLPPVP